MTIFVPIEPIGAPRPRVTKNAVYYPKKYTDTKRIIGLIAKKTMAISDKPIRLHIECFFSIPKSWTKAKKQSAKWHTSKPDADNIAKTVKDALNKIAYNDDSQVCELIVTKQYAEEYGVRITLDELN